MHKSSKQILKHFDCIKIKTTAEKRVMGNTKAASRKITDEIINTKIMGRGMDLSS